MKKERHKYQLPSMMRGIQVHKTCWAKSDTEAAKKLDVSLYNIRTYAIKYNKGEEFDDVRAFMDSGKIIFENNRKDLMNKEMPKDELKNIIDTYQDKSYAIFKKQMGI